MCSLEWRAGACSDFSDWGGPGGALTCTVAACSICACALAICTQPTSAPLPTYQVPQCAHHGLTLCRVLQLTEGIWNLSSFHTHKSLPAALCGCVLAGPREGADRGGSGSGFQAKLNSATSRAEQSLSDLRKIRSKDTYKQWRGKTSLHTTSLPLLCL